MRSSDRSRGSIRLMGLLLGLLLLLPGMGIARAEESGPSLEVLEVGWEGQISQGNWAPVRVKVTGGSWDLDGLVEVTLEDVEQLTPTTSRRIPRVAYAQELSVPANAAKEVTIWLPAVQSSYGTVRLKSIAAQGQSEETLASREIEFRATKAPYWPLIGVLAADDTLATAVGKIEMPLQNLPTSIHVTKVEPSSLPGYADRLRGLRALVVQGNAPAHLSDEQRQAVHGWVLSGGHLLLAGGPDSALTAGVLPEGVLPVTFGGAELSVDLSPLWGWVGGPATAPPTASARLTGPAVRFSPTGGSLLAGSEAQPLAWRTTLGKGSITLLAVDPTLEPLASHPQRIPLLKSALSAALYDEQMTEDQRWQLYHSTANPLYQQLQGSVQQLPTRAFPGWQQVGLYLGGFALIAGPLIHLLFRANRRRGWVWVAVPMASLLVSGVIYASAIPLGHRDVLANTISHLRLDPASGVATHSAAIGLFAPMHSKLSVNLAPEAAANGMVMIDAYGWRPWQEQTDSPYRMINGRQSRLEFLGGAGGTRALGLSRTIPGAGGVKSSLKLEGEMIKGSLKNETPYRLDQVWVVVGATAEPLGSLDPGETVELSLKPVSAAPFYYVSTSQLLLGQPLSETEMRRRHGLPDEAPLPQGMYFAPEIPREPEAMRRASLLESALQSVGRGGNSPSLPLSLIGFTQDPVGAEVIDLQGHPTYSLTLVEQRLHLDLGPGSFRIPGTLMPPEMTFAGGWGTGSNESISWMEVHGGTMLFEFTPPITSDLELTALELNTQQLGASVAINPSGGWPAPFTDQPEGGEAGLFQLYNWQEQRWDQLPGGQEQARLTNPAAYLSPAGKVRLQVGAPDRIVRFVVPQLVVEGRAGR